MATVGSERGLIAASALIFGVAALVLLPLAWWAGPAPVVQADNATLTLEQAASRKAPEFSPAFEGQDVVVQGEVPYRAIAYLEFSHLHIQDETLHGLTLEGPEAMFHNIGPGDVVEVHGKISKRAGLPVLLPSEIRKVGARPAQAPQPLRLDQLAGPRYLGVLVNTEGLVEDKGFDGGGEYLMLSGTGKRLRVFMPRTATGARSGFARFHAGDRVRVGGVAGQFCAQPPYTDGYEIVVDDPEAVATLESGAYLPPLLLASVMLCVMVVFGIWKVREHRTSAQRAVMRAMNSLGEEMISLAAPAPIVRRLNEVLPKAVGISGVRLYLYRKASRSLERVGTNQSDGVSLPLAAPPDPIATGAALCFKNRTTLNVPDTRRSPFLKGANTAELPRSVMFVPMFSQSDCIGVLEFDHDQGMRFFNRDEQGATQHLANQIATALKLQEQNSMQEQLFRSEKLAAAGQLISGVADELRTPLRSIASLAHVLLERCADEAMSRDLRAISVEALRAGEIVEHLVSFTSGDEGETTTLDLHHLLTNLIQFREREWKKRGVELRNRILPEPLLVLASQSQLEQVFLSLLVHAEQSLAQAREQHLTVSTALFGRRALVEIAYSQNEDEPATDPFQSGAEHEGGLGLGVSRAIVHGHGGDIRMVNVPGQGTRFEVELPLAQSAENERGEARPPARSLTVLLLEPEPSPQRQLLTLLSARAHRVVPIASPMEVAELVQRLRFDALFCSLRLPGMNWVELFERVQGKVGAFVLLTEGYNADLARAFQGNEGYLLSKPVKEVELVRLLESLENRAAVPAPPVQAVPAASAVTR